MSDIHNLPKPLAKLRFRGDFDWDGLYKMIRSWLEQHGYEFFEKKYKHKEKVLGSELELSFAALHDLSDYTRDHITLFIKIWNYHEKEIVVDGKKRKTGHGRLLIEFSGSVELDYENRWEDTQLKRTLRQFYHHFIIRNEIENLWEDKLYYEILGLQRDVKGFLGMESRSEVYE